MNSALSLNNSNNQRADILIEIKHIQFPNPSEIVE